MKPLVARIDGHSSSTPVAIGRIAQSALIALSISAWVRWKVAAGGLILECAGGEFWIEATPGPHKFRMIASNRLIHKKLPLPK